MTPAMHIRWMIRRDMAEVLLIDRDSFAQPWDEAAYLKRLRERNVIGLIAEYRDDVIGALVYELHPKHIEVLRLAVAPGFRCEGVGRAFIAKLEGKLAPGRREHLSLSVRESNLDAQLFLSRMGFTATRVIRGYYQDTGEDAYRMEYSVRAVVTNETNEQAAKH